MDINAALMRRVKAPATKPKRLTPRKGSPSTASVVPTSTHGAAKRKLLAMASPTKSSEQKSPPLTKKRKNAVSESATAPTSSLFASPTKAVPRTQAYIDAGQKSFGNHTTCRTCGLLYTIGEERDEKEHQRFCKTSRKGITIAKWKNERLMKAFPEQKARIIEIRREDPPAHVSKLMEIKTCLDDALGFVEKPAFLQRSHFVYIQEKQVVGCVTVERVETAFLLDKSAPNLVVATPQRDGSVSTVTAANPHAVVAGICQIWVHPAFRGKKVATRLVDTVREKYIYGMRVAKTQIAFAQPTKNGLRFAEKYVAPHEVLVCDDISHRNERAP